MPFFELVRFCPMSGHRKNASHEGIFTTPMKQHPGCPNCGHPFSLSGIFSPSGSKGEHFTAGPSPCGSSSRHRFESVTPFERSPIREQIRNRSRTRNAPAAMPPDDDGGTIPGRPPGKATETAQISTISPKGYPRKGRQKKAAKRPENGPMFRTFPNFHF